MMLHQQKLKPTEIREHCNVISEIKFHKAANEILTTRKNYYESTMNRDLLNRGDQYTYS